MQAWLMCDIQARVCGHSSHRKVANLRFSLIGDGGMKHGSDHCRTVWPILLLNHVHASCMPATQEPVKLLPTQAEAAVNPCTVGRPVAFHMWLGARGIRHSLHVAANFQYGLCWLCAKPTSRARQCTHVNCVNANESVL